MDYLDRLASMNAERGEIFRQLVAEKAKRRISYNWKRNIVSAAIESRNTDLNFERELSDAIASMEIDEKDFQAFGMRIVAIVRDYISDLISDDHIDARLAQKLTENSNEISN